MSSANMHLLLGHTHLLSLLFFIEHKHSDYRFTWHYNYGSPLKSNKLIWLIKMLLQ